jgi:hypothetical protein
MIWTRSLKKLFFRQFSMRKKCTMAWNLISSSELPYEKSEKIFAQAPQINILTTLETFREFTGFATFQYLIDSSP